MAEVIVAIGSNLGDRHAMVKRAGDFLESCSLNGIQKSSIWESEPVGGAKYTFYNSVVKISTDLQPRKLLIKMKKFERESGRDPNFERWGPRLLDLDIIAFDNLVIEQENLIIPHKEYKNRLFVLYPLKEIDNEWQDPVTQNNINELIKNAPKIDIIKTDLDW